MKKILVSSLLATSVMFAVNTDLDNLAKINNTQLKQNIWSLGDKSLDISVIHDQEIKRFFVSFMVTYPYGAKVVVDNFQTKTCKNDLSFFNTISLNDIKEFVHSKQYATLLEYVYSSPAVYENVKNNVQYLMCGTNSFTPDITTIKSSNDKSSLSSITKASLLVGHYFLPEYNYSINSIFFQGLDSCIYSGSAKYSMGSEKVDVVLDKKSCVVNGKLELSDIKGYVTENYKSGLNAQVDYSKDTVAYLAAGKEVEVSYINVTK